MDDKAAWHDSLPFFPEGSRVFGISDTQRGRDGTSKCAIVFCLFLYFRKYRFKHTQDKAFEPFCISEKKKEGRSKVWQRNIVSLSYTAFFSLKTQCPAIIHLLASLSHRHMLESSCHVAFGEL